MDKTMIQLIKNILGKTIARKYTNVGSYRGNDKIKRGKNQLGYFLPWVKSYSTPTPALESSLHCATEICVPLLTHTVKPVMLTVIVHIPYAQNQVNTLVSSNYNDYTFSQVMTHIYEGCITSWVRPCALWLLDTWLLVTGAPVRASTY